MAENILLHTEHLSKKFGEQFILKDISLDVKKSEVVVICLLYTSDAADEL